MASLALMWACSFMLQWFMLKRFSVHASACSFLLYARSMLRYTMLLFLLLISSFFNAYCFRKKMHEEKEEKKNENSILKINGKVAFTINQQEEEKEAQKLFNAIKRWTTCLPRSLFAGTCNNKFLIINFRKVSFAPSWHELASVRL